MPAPQKNQAGQLQDAKDEIARLKTALENRSKVDDDLRESQAENSNLRSLLEQAKSAAIANNSKARITDLEREAQELRAQLNSISSQYHELKNLYDSRIGNVSTMERQLAEAQTSLRNAQQERDTYAGHIRNVQQTASEKVTNSDNEKTKMNELLRQTRLELAQYANIVLEVRSLLRNQPDVLAAVRQKVGL